MKENVYTSGYGEDLRISHESSRLLMSISKWTRFLSILAFVILGLMLLSVLIVGIGGSMSSMSYYENTRGMYAYMPGMYSWVYAAVYIIMLLVLMIPTYYLLKFSMKVKSAVLTNNSMVLTESIHFLQKYYLFVGILSIIWLVLFVLSMILMIAGFSGMGMY